MIKKSLLTRPIRQINLSLPVIQTDLYEIYYTVPGAHGRQLSTKRSILRSKTFIDHNDEKNTITTTTTTTNTTTTTTTTNNNNNNNNNNNTDNKKPTIPTTRLRSPGRLTHLTGPVTVNLLVEMPTIPIESTTSVADALSNGLNNRNNTAATLRTASTSTTTKPSKDRSTKNDEVRSQSSGGDRLLYESLVSFEDTRAIKTKNIMLQTIHCPRLITAKTLHTRRAPKRILETQEMHLKVPKSISLEHLLQESVTSSRQRLNEKIEELTRHYFPTIGQIRRGQPGPDVLNYRTHLHREDKKEFIPMVSRSRLVP